MQTALIHKLIELKAKPPIIQWATHNPRQVGAVTAIMSVVSMALNARQKEKHSHCWEGPTIDFYKGQTIIGEFGTDHINEELHNVQWMRAQWTEANQGLVLKKFTPASPSFNEFAIAYPDHRNYADINRMIVTPRATFYTLSDNESYRNSSWCLTFRVLHAQWHDGQGGKNWPSFSDQYDIMEDGAMILANLVEINLVGNIANFDSAALVYKLSF